MNVRSEASLLVVVVIFGVLIGVAYAYVLPAFFPGYRTGWILNLGVLAAILVGGYIGSHVPNAKALQLRIILGCCYAMVTAILVYFLSLFIIFNVRGS